MFKKIWKDCRGQDLIEYALLAAMIAIIAAALMPGANQLLKKGFELVQKHSGQISLNECLERANGNHEARQTCYEAGKK